MASASFTAPDLRELRSALASFDRAKEWEWSDLIKWLELVKSIIEGFNSFDFEEPEKYLLFKRLAQCLNPNLPPGLHYNTLRIYESMLTKIFSTEQSMSDNISMISAGIFPFFEYASPQTKPIVIHLIHEYYLKLGEQLTLCLSGMMSSLLTGLEDVSDTDVSTSLFKLFDEIASFTRRGVFAAVWQALLKSPRAKVGALTFLMKRMQKLEQGDTNFEANVETYIPNKELVVNALIAGLRDSEVFIKRPTLDVIKSFFPLRCPFLTPQAFNTLLIEVLALLAVRDFTLSRRVWEWLGLHDPGVDIPSVVEILTPALMEFFDRQQASEEEVLDPIGIMESLLDQPELTVNLLEEFTSHFLRYVHRFKDYKNGGEVLARLKSLINSHSEDLGVVWSHLNQKLDDQQRNFDLDQTLNAIELMLSLELEAQTEFLIPVLDNMLRSMENYPKKERAKAQNLVLSVLGKAPGGRLGSCVESYEKFLAEALAGEEPLESDQLSLSLQVYIALQSYQKFPPSPEWLRLLLQVVPSEITENALVAAQYILNLSVNFPEISSTLNHETDNQLAWRMVSPLWFLCVGKYQTEAAELIIHYFEVDEFQGEVARMLKEWLSVADVTQLSQNLQRFTVLWKVAQNLSSPKRDQSKDYLMLFFQHGVGIFEAIEALEHSVPLIRHLGKQWLMQAINRLNVLIHAVLPLSPLPKEETITRDAIRRLRMMIENGGESFVGKLREAIREVDHFEKGSGGMSPSYYNTILYQIVMKVFMKETPEGVAHELNPLQSDACVVVKQLLSWGDSEAATELSPSLLWKLAKVVERKDLVLQYQFIEVMQIIIFKSNLNVDQLRKVISSPDFLKMIVQGLNAESHSALAFWMRLLPEFLRLALSLLPAVEVSCKLFKDLMAKLGSIMQDYRDLAIIDTYVTLLHLALEISSPSTFAKRKPFGDYFAKTFGEFVSLNMHPNVNSLLITLVTGVEKSDMHSTYKVLIAVFREAREMLVRWPAIPSSQPIRRAESPSQYESVVRALKPLAEKFPNELTAVFIKAWFALFEEPGAHIDNEKNKLIQIYLDLRLLGTQVLSSFEKFLREGLDLKKSGRRIAANLLDIRICDLLNNLFESKCFLNVDSLEAWKLIIRITEAFSYSACPECPLWAAELMVSAHKVVPFEHSDRKMVKEVQLRVQTLIQHIISICTSQSSRAIDICPPSASAVVTQEDSIHVCALLTLKAALYELVQLGWESGEMQVSQLRTLLTPLLQSILEGRATLQDDMATDLIADMVQKSTETFAQRIQRDIIDFFVTDEFWNKLKRVKFDFNHWRRLLGLLVKKCFDFRQPIVIEILKKLNIGFFTSKSSEIQQRSKILRCLALVIFSGDLDEYQDAKEKLTERIIEELKVHEGALIPVVFLLCRVLVVKLDAPSLADIWPRLWPHLFVELVRIFSENVAPMHQLAAIKLLELLYLTGIEDFQYFSWVFFGTASSNRQELEFKPCVEKLFSLPPDFKLTVTEVRDSTKKGLTVTLTSAESIEDIKDQVQKLLTSIIEDSSTSISPDFDSVSQVLEADILNLDVI